MTAPNGQRAIDLVGFIGLGTMGAPMARRLRAAGLKLVVFDARPEVTQAFAAENTQVATSPAEVFEAAEAVITMLPNGQIVQAVVAEALAARATGGADLLIDMSSSDPADTAHLKAMVGEHGIELLDAPVSGGLSRAISGQLSILVGGSEQGVARATPLFEAIGSAIFPCGEVGTGHAMKAINNVMSAGGLVLAGEAMLIGGKYGLNPHTMLKVLNASTGRNHATETKIDQFILSGDYNSGFGLNLMLKDLRIAQGLAHRVGSPFVLGSALTSLWDLASTQRAADADQTDVVRWLEELAGRPFDANGPVDS